jgi:hypothetical protein
MGRFRPIMGMDKDSEDFLLALLRKEGVKNPDRARYIIAVVGTIARGEGFATRRDGKLYFCYHDEEIYEGQVN